jgi:hypothetical protein
MLRHSDISSVWTVLSRTLAPNQSRPIHAQTGIFELVVVIVSLLFQRRADLVNETLPSAVHVLCSMLRVLQCPRNGRAIRGPFWLAEPLDSSAATSFSRLLSSLASRRFASGNKSTSLASSFVKHTSAILVAYVRASADPFAGLSTAVRRELEPGLFALCELITVGGRVDGRGREGEGVGLPFGLGEGPGGEAEKELWADLWRDWKTKRYTGQG